MRIADLRRIARDVDPEPIAALTTRMLEIWSPPGEESEIAAVAHRALIDAGAEDVTLDEDVPGSPSVLGL